MKSTFIVLIVMLICFQSYGQKPRARDLGVPFVGKTGEFNAITDVKGVEVGYSTIISGNGKNNIGKGPIRTGVTAIF
ncbi:MAG: P1 family peptidase, partial [Spirosomataceae bacterium]